MDGRVESEEAMYDRRNGAVFATSFLLMCAGLTGCVRQPTFYVTGAPDQAGTALFAPGDRVECNWRQLGTIYSGSVTGIRDGRLSIAYDDGDKEDIMPSLCSKVGGSPVSATPAPAAPPPASGGGQGEACKRDRECSGDLVCESGKCVAQ
jgi:hypothetical protein